MSPDSLFYWSAARTIYEQGAIATPVSAVDWIRTVGDPRTPPDVAIHSPRGPLYPLTKWPPGYPLAIAAFMPLTGGSAIAAARLLAVVTLLALIGAFAAVASRLMDARRAVFAAALLGCLPFVHGAVRMMLSDALFAALALVALALAAGAFHTARRPGAVLALAAVVAAAATYVRYTGVLVLAAPTLVAGFMALRDSGRRPFFLKALLAMALYMLLVTPLFARNVLLTGHITTGQLPPSRHSAFGLLTGLFASYARALVPWLGRALPSTRGALVSAGASLVAWGVAGAGVLLAIRRTGGLRRSPDHEIALPPMVPILAVFAALYTTVLIALSAVWHVELATRMHLPAVAGVATLAVWAFQRRIADDQLFAVNGTAIGMIALVTITSLGAADHFGTWRGFNHPGFLDRGAAHWARRTLAQAEPGTPVRLLSVGRLIPYLHLATDGAPVGGLPDVPDPASLLGRAPRGATVVILEPGATRFRCTEYRRRYARVMDVAADSTSQGEDFTAWWLSAAGAERLEQEATGFGSLCGP